MSIWFSSCCSRVLKLNWWWKFHPTFKRREDPTKLYYRRTVREGPIGGDTDTDPASLIYLGSVELFNNSEDNRKIFNFCMTYLCTVCEATLGITGWILRGALIDAEDYYLDVGLTSPEECRSPLRLVCSTINKLLDLSLNRCKTGWILSLMILLAFSTKGV